MSNRADPGEMRTRVRILRPVDAPDAEGYTNPSYTNIYPDNRTIRCKWIAAFGAEAVQAQSLGLTDTATLTMRYDPRITPDCVVAKCGAAENLFYEIISSPNDVAGAHRYMEIRVKRRTVAL